MTKSICIIGALDGAWLFAERNLYVDRIDTRTSQP